MSEEDAAALDGVVDAVFIDRLRARFPAVYVGVWQDGVGAYETACGVAEVGATPASVDDSVRIGSVTKSMTATVLLQLVDDGKLALKDHVKEVAPRDRGTSSRDRDADRQAAAGDEQWPSRPPQRSRRRARAGHCEPAAGPDP